MSTATDFDLSTYMDAVRSEIDATLDQLLPPVDQRPSILHDAMRYSVFSGGKRIRPILCMAAWRACQDGNVPVDAPIPDYVSAAACAIELLHTYTLVHDDLPCMDNDDTRRGKPTAHIAYGEANALLSGDALLTLAFEITAGADMAADAGQGFATLDLARAAGSTGVVGGQVVDLAAAGQSVTREDVNFIHLNKTAKLFQAATTIGARLAGAQGSTLNALIAYGEKLGLAFQVVDDILDDLQDQREQPEEASDPSLSCLSVMNMDEARSYAARLTADATAALADLDQTARRPLIAIVEQLEKREI
jgi:geranylgeranyl diphosphate synthase type II